MKKYIFTLIFIFLIANCLLFPRIALEASGNGIVTWFYQILPSLLPFTIISSIFMRSKWLDVLSQKGNLFPVLIILFCGTMFGFPIGGKLSCDFYTQGYISKSQAEILCVCTNNFSPMYVNGFVIPLIFGINTFLFPFLFLIYGIPLMIGIILLVYNGKKEITQKKSASRFQLDMQIIDAGIISGFETLIKICGYIVLFSLLTAFCSNLLQNISIPGLLLLGNLEISNGIFMLSEYSTSQPLKYMIAIQLLSFGGICGLAQTSSFLSQARLSSKKYVLGKIALSLLLSIIAIITIFQP